MDLAVETLDFKFLLKPKDAETPCIIEEGPTRLLTGGMLEGDVRVALFKLNGDDEVLEFGVVNKADLVSPLELAASWRVYKENFQPSKVRGIPDISINVAPTNGAEVIAFVLDIVCFPVVMHMVAKFCANDRDRAKPMHMVAKFCENDRYPCRALDMCFGMV